MRIADVIAVLDLLDAAALRYWVGGGWGVDALVGSRTRAHRDLDLAVEAHGIDEAVRLLGGLGYRPQTDWLPVRLELAAPDDRWVDLHPLTFGSEGGATQAGPAAPFRYPAADLRVGWLDGRPVPAISARLQREFHQGYPPRPQDLHDLTQLDRLGTRTESALLLEVPAAEPAVGAARRRFDHSAAWGVPAHLTALYPFVPQPDLDAAALRGVAAVAAATAPIELVLGSIGWFDDDVVWAAPEDPAPLRSLTAALTAAFPTHPPYGGAFENVVPHLTIGDHGAVAALAAAAAQVLPQLPIRQRLTSLSLWAGGDVPDSWVRLQRFPLGG